MSDTPKVNIVPTYGDSMLTDSSRFEHTWRVAKVFAGSQLIPPHLRGKIEDVMVALHVAERLRDDPLTVLQSIYIVQGKAGWSGSYMVARINQSGLIKGRISWSSKGTGENLSVTASAVLADTGEVVSAEASMRMAIGEGWIKNPKYQTMPEHMLRWRAASMLTRLYFPEVMLGMSTAEELEDNRNTLKDVTPEPTERPTAAIALEQFAKAQAPIEPDAVLVNVATTNGTAEEPLERPKRTRKPKIDAPPPPAMAAQDPLPATPAEDAFSADHYLKQALSSLRGVTSVEELYSAHEVVRDTLKQYPSQLGMWNASRLARESELLDESEAMSR